MKTALLIIDVQKYYINEHTKDIPLKIEKYIKENKLDYIIFAQFINHKNAHHYKAFNWKKMQFSPDIDICDNLVQFIKKDNVFQKDTYSLFKSLRFNKYLKNNNIQKVFICGFDTDACVLATAYEAFDLGYYIKILHDLTKSHRGEKYTKIGKTLLNDNLNTKENY
jgi:nicotinamidase-related amidase